MSSSVCFCFGLMKIVWVTAALYGASRQLDDIHEFTLSMAEL